MAIESQIVSFLKKDSRRDKAIELIIEHFGERLFNLIQQIVRDEALAQDVFQETLMKYWQHGSQFKGKSGLYTWLYRIAYNQALNEVRKRKVETVEQMPTMVASTPTQDPQEVLFKAIQVLPEQQKAVFHLRYFDELPYNEISQIMGLTVGALKANYHHAVKKIENIIKAD